MKNFWIIFGIHIFTYIGFIVVGIVLYIKKGKYYIWELIIVIAALLFLTYESIPFVKDVVKQETTQFTAVYVEYQKGSVDPGAWRLIFESENERYKVISPIITKIHVKMEKGKIYQIEYFNNTKIIKSYKLIE